MMAWQAVLIGLVVLPAGGAEWQDFVWRRGECVALMPGKPQLLSRSIPGPNGTNLEVFIQSAEAKGVAYLLSFVDNPTFKGADEKQLDEALNKARDGAVGKGKLVKETRIKHGPYPGRDLLIEMPGKGTFSRLQLFIADQKMYQLIVVGPRDACLAKEAEQFLESFKLLR
jgi:hypothetical protein